MFSKKSVKSPKMIFGSMALLLMAATAVLFQNCSETLEIEDTSASTAAGTIYITSAPPSMTVQTTATFTFNGFDSSNNFLSTFSCQLDSQAPTACNGTITYSNLSVGQHMFTLTGLSAQGAVVATQNFVWEVSGSNQPPTATPTNVPGATATPTPTMVPGATATPTPTATPTSVPGATATPTSTPTPTVVAAVPLVRINCTMTSYHNGFDQTVNYQTSGNFVFSGEESIHNNNNEDRIFRNDICELAGSGIGTFVKMSQTVHPSASTFVNTYDNPVNFVCPGNKVMTGHYSVHNNNNEDRVFRYFCSDMVNPNDFSRVAVRNTCTWYPSTVGYVNNFDSPVDFNCPGNQVMTGVHSYHSSNNEDRRFRFQCCDYNSQ